MYEFGKLTHTPDVILMLVCTCRLYGKAAFAKEEKARKGLEWNKNQRT